MNNIKKIASEIIKEARDKSTERGIKFLWEKFNNDLKEFGKKVGDLVRKNKLSMSSDRGWLLKLLKDLTGESWKLTGYDFKVASKKEK